ncbi:MAG TPA: PhaM family polyhydroxyalkanoate granule multifunctional regulatory protein [Telluria sp.]
MQNPSMPGMPGATDTLEFVKNLWGGMGIPGMTAPTLSVDDLDKKITDLKAVEAWLALNSTMVRGTIQALEVQRGTLAALKSMGDAFAKASAQGGSGAAPAGSDAGGAAPFTDPAAWWNMLQDQFKQAVNTAMSPEAMAEATSRAQDAASKMTAAMPTAEMGKAMQESMAKAAGAGGPAPKAGQGKPRSGKAGNGE